MPVIGQGDDNCIDGFVVQNSAKIAVSGDLLAPILERLGLAVEVRLVHVAQRDDLCAGNLSHSGNELMPAPANAADGRG